jgi:hypothetical protein
MHTTGARTPCYQFCFNRTINNTLNIGTGSVPEKLAKISHLGTDICSRKNFIEKAMMSEIKVKEGRKG